jgi:adenine-specific DNA-methyltransferase
MVNNTNIQAEKHESPANYADRLGLFYSSLVSTEHKKKNGQFFTPLKIASLMASYCECRGEKVRILDPGCGSSVLSCALIEHLICINKELKDIELVVYETDLKLIDLTEKVIIYLKQWLLERNIVFNYIFHQKDFILENAGYLNNQNNLFSLPFEPFDIVISNPPYFKLAIEDKRAKAARIVINGHPNIYAIFMAISVRLLKQNGEFIFITPRSYASGGYFKIFRNYFFNLIDLEKVHLFVSRKDAFSKDKILQETVIIKGKRINDPNENSHVIISSSTGLYDIDKPLIKSFPKKDIIDIRSGEKILYLPTNDFEENIMEIFNNWTGTLGSFNIKISTGPVVAFRSWDYIKDEYENLNCQLAPLFWLHNVKQMVLEWPLQRPDKGQYIQISKESKALLIPNKNYILLRRFSSKDDKSRLIAAPYFSNLIEAGYIGVENKVNYIYRQDGYLERNEIIGLCALLNSSLFDAFFRIFNGNVNVSATELREMPLPPLNTIKEIGDSIILSNDFSIKNCKRIIQEFFEPELVS